MILRYLNCENEGHVLGIALHLYMVNNWSSIKRYASPKAGMELYLDLVFRQ